MKTRLQPLNYAPLKVLSKLILTCLLLLPLALATAQADLELLPASSTVNVGDNLTLTLQVVAGSQEVDGVEAYLDFDPNFVTINTVTFEASAQLPIPLVSPTIDPAGEINSAHGLFGGGFVTGTFDYITIDLTADAAGSTAISFSFDPGPPINRATLISRSGFSVLGNTSGANITIVGSNTPPTVSITAPTDGAIVNEGDNVTINATAADPGGSITGVEFFDGATSLGTDNTAPYSVTLNNISAGAHTLTAVATDNESATTTSTAVNITANATGGPTVPVITIGGPATKIVVEEGSLQVPISVSDLDGDNLTVTISSVSNEPQFLQSANGGTQADPFPITADNFLTTTNISNTPGSYTADLNFDPIFGDGGGADGDGNGEYTITIDVSDGTNNVSSTFDVEVTDVHQVISSSGTTRIEAESFDNQGPPNGSAGNTSDSNGIGVEINPGAATNIGFTNAGDFAEYLIDVVQAGTYDISFQVAKSSGTAATMTINGGPASISVSPTGGWQTYTTVTAQVTLAAGLQTLRFDWSGSGFLFNIDYFDLVPLAPNDPPVITLLGANPLDLIVGDTYTDPGATALDDNDGDISVNIVVGGDVVDTNNEGTYIVTYNVSDAAGAPATEVTRTVNVAAADEACAYVAINPSGNNILTSSTFSNGLIITNNSQGSIQITSVSFDLGTAIYPNMVFDPVGTAGDNLAKCLTIVSETGGDGSVGLSTPGNGGTGSDPDCVAPFAGETEIGTGGYYVMNTTFTDFEPGESINLSIDIDPTSIEGFASAGNAGAISGLELIGSTITVEFSNGQSVTGELYRIQPDLLDGSENYLYPGSECAAPGLTVLGANPATTVAGFNDATVGGENQVVQISGTPGDAVSLLILESTIEDLGPGITPGEFEANKAQTVEEIDAVIGAGGTVDIPVVLADNASGEIYHLVAVKVRPDDGICGVGTCNTSDVWRLKVSPIFGDPSVLVEITPGAGLGASTFGGSSSLQITNNSTGNLQVTDVSIDLSTGILPDMVFDPVGAGGDATAQCFTAGGTATTVGLVVPTDVCVDPFSAPRFGGFDIISLGFTEFDPGEDFTFSVDIDPNSIKDVPGAGNAGAVSGYELSGATVTISFNDGSTIVSSLYEDGSLGGGQTVVEANAPATPTISVVGVASSPATVGDLNQTVTVSGTPGDNISLLLMDSRLFIASGDPAFNVPDPTYYANEAMSGKTLYTAVIEPDGDVDIPITLLVTPGATGTPDGGLNQLIAVSSATPYLVDQAVSQTSNVVTLLYDPNAAIPDLTIEVTRQGVTDYSGDYTAQLYQVGAATPDYDLIGTADAAGTIELDGIAPGTYEVAVKYPNCLQIVESATITGNGETLQLRELRTGDINDDNAVNILDFSLQVNSFEISLGESGYNANANLNDDLIVNILDFSLLISNFLVDGEEPSGL